MIQSTMDDLICKQEVKINQISIWKQELKCPSKKTGTQYIYMYCDDDRSIDADIRNFKFFTSALTK